VIARDDGLISNMSVKVKTQLEKKGQLTMTTEDKIQISLQKGEYEQFWQLNCAFCEKSIHRGGKCQIQSELCFASAALHGLGDRLPTEEVTRLLGAGTISQEVAERIGVTERNCISAQCPEQEVLFLGEHQRDEGMTAEKLTELAEEYERREGKLV
jgi:hypothetical protein